MERMSLTPGREARTILCRHVVGLQTRNPFTGLTLGLLGTWQPANLTHGRAH
jgi:hypothetical protein